MVLQATYRTTALEHATTLNRASRHWYGRRMPDEPAFPTDDDLERFREVQQLAYRCVIEVADGLDEGVTERETCARMRRWLRDNGTDDWFHVPFAWFGDRSAFRGFRTPLQFFPTTRRLADGMAFILDVAPIRDGAVADVGYAAALGDCPVQAAILDDLEAHRDLILERVRSGDTMAQVYDAVDALARQQGYDNRHREYPFRVLAHQVDAVPGGLGSGLAAGGFGVRTLATLLRSVAEGGRRPGGPPLWNGDRGSARPPGPGLWAVEPHLGLRGVGAKFEELLVVRPDGDAFWLDDDLPHVRRWAAQAHAGARP